MHTIKLKVNDKIYSHIIYFLKNLNKHDIEIVEDRKNSQEISTKKSITKLFKNKNIDIFNEIKDPMKWQKKQRDEW